MRAVVIAIGIVVGVWVGLEILHVWDLVWHVAMFAR
jgi:hypothetical protein